MIINFYHRNNDLFKDGKLDEQIIADLEAYIKEQNRYQKEHLDVRVKTEAPHHYDAWTEKTQLGIKYAERILECVKAYIKSEV